MKNVNSRGNVLFLILIAVALFAALSYAVTQSSRSGGGSAKKEKLQTDIAVMLQYGSTLRSAIQRLMITNGCSDEQLSASAPASVGDWAYASNGAAPADKHCHIFAPAGGGVAFQKPPASLVSAPGTEYVISGIVGVWDVGLNDCEKTELLMYTFVTREACIAINEQLGNENPSGEPPDFPVWHVGSHAYFGWGWSAGASEYGCGMHIGYPSETPTLRGKRTGCFSGEGNYNYYDVLLDR